MGRLFIVLFIASVGVQAFRRARRDAAWSWGEFGYTLGALVLVIVLLVPWIFFLADRLGPEHALLATVLIVVSIIVLVVLLALHLQARRKRRASSRMPLPH